MYAALPHFRAGKQDWKPVTNMAAWSAARPLVSQSSTVSKQPLPVCDWFGYAVMYAALTDVPTKVRDWEPVPDMAAWSAAYPLVSQSSTISQVQPVTQTQQSPAPLLHKVLGPADGAIRILFRSRVLYQSMRLCHSAVGL
jgi:hypothetical protein